MSGEVLKAARSGDRRVTLEVLRDRLAGMIDEDLEPRDLAALSRRLEVVVAELDAMGSRSAKESIADALAARRSAKQAAAG